MGDGTGGVGEAAEPPVPDAPGSPAEATRPGGPASNAAPAVPTTGDRLLLGLFVAYAALLLFAAWAQVSADRTLLDLVDFRKLFVK